MTYKFLILAFSLSLIACEQLDKPVFQNTAYEKQPLLNYNMNCKQISAALAEAKASLERIKKRRETVTDEDVTFFVLSMGTHNYGGMIAQKDADDRILLLESALVQRSCVVK